MERTDTTLFPETIHRKGAAMLAAAVVRQAVKDWKDAKELLERIPSDLDAQETVLEVELFFRSGWFGFLREFAPDMIPEDMMRRLDG